MAINNKLKFLLSSIIILGGYITASDCYCMEIENNNQVNQNNNYLVELCNQNKVNVDENGNILENDSFLNDENYLKEITHEIYSIVDKNLKVKISNNTYDNFTRFLRLINTLCNDYYGKDFFAPSVQNIIISLNQNFPQLIKLNSKYKDNITLLQLQNYLKNKIRLLLINCCNEIINNQTNKDKSELENLVINKARNLYIDVKSILIWLPDFVINTLHMDEQYFLLKCQLIISNIVQCAMYLNKDKDLNIIYEEDENLMQSYKCYGNTIFSEQKFNAFLEENSTNISQNILSILDTLNQEEFLYKILDFSLDFPSGNIINSMRNIQLSRTELNHALPEIITLNTNSKHGNKISLSQFMYYLSNKLALLFIQCRANICKKNKEVNKHKNKKVLENIIKQELKVFYDKFNKVISWLPEFLKKKNVPEDILTSYIQELSIKIALVNRIMLITNEDSNGYINIEENNNFLIYNGYLKSIYFKMRDEISNDFKNINNVIKFYSIYQWFKSSDNFKDINNWCKFYNIYKLMRDEGSNDFKNINNLFTFYDIYEFFKILNFNGGHNKIINYNFCGLQKYVNKTQLLPNDLKQKFYKIITLPINYNSDISVLRVLTYLSNKFQLLLINCFNEMRQYIKEYKKEYKNDTQEYKTLNDRIKMKRIKKMMNYTKQIFNIMEWLKYFLTGELNQFQNLEALLEEYRQWEHDMNDNEFNANDNLPHDAIKCGKLNDALQQVNDSINLLTHSVLSFDVDFDKIMEKFESKQNDILSQIPHDNNSQITENENFINSNFESLFSNNILYDFYQVFLDTYHSKKYASIPRIGEWASEVYNIIGEFDHCAQRGLNHIYKIIELYNDYPLLQESLSKTFNREELNNKFKDILNDINQNEKNIIIDNENFIYVDKNTKPYLIGMEKIDPQKINLFQLIQYCGNKIFKEEVNTFSRIINACKNDNDPDHFQQILKDNMLIGCKRINGVICVLYTFLENIKNTLWTEVARNETREESIKFIKDIVTKEDLLRFMIKRNIVSRENLRSLAPKINISEEDLLEFINTIEKENSLKFDNSTNKAKLFEFISNISKEELLKRINNISKDDLLKLVQAIHQEYSEDCKYTITTFINNLKDSKRKIDEFIKQFILNGLLDMDI